MRVSDFSMLWTPKLDSVGGSYNGQLSRLHCSNKGLPPIWPDEDPKLAQGSRPSVKKTETPGTQDQVSSSVGTNGDNNREPLLHVVDDDVRALYLAVDAPQTY